ncbi:MAG: hypothetical protein COA47_09975 [Robiginitomaculum sp.]|nr:MAG: hypothetical protein COA47_09975 [Robiginitomaculum sp.]
MNTGNKTINRLKNQVVKSIRIEMNKLGDTQKDIAKECDVLTQSEISLIQREIHEKFTLDRLIRIRRELGFETNITLSRKKGLYEDD